jgi:tRNA(fMet)-specific endonuclease VapC
MIAFDADILTDILAGHAGYYQRAALIPANEQAVPVVVIEEILRGRLNSIRQAEAAKSRVSLERAYALFEQTLDAFRQVNVLSYCAAAESLFQAWRSQKLRAGTHDLRIAAICVTTGATLATRNRRDFEQIPGLSLDVWA